MGSAPALSSLTILPGLLVSLGALALFRRISEAVFISQVVAELDWQVISMLRQLAHPAAHYLMLVATWLGSFPTLLVLAAGASLRLWRRGRRSEAVWLLLCLAGANVLTLGLKTIYRRPRPDFFPLVRAGGYSYPSGHAMVSLPFYGFLAYAGSRISPRHRFWFLAAAAAIVLAIGLSRIYLGVHWPSDILAGYSAGAIWLASCIIAEELGEHWRRQLTDD